jgi:hypothetical protein
VHGATPCTTLGVPEFSQGRAYGDSLGAALGGRADRMRVPFPNLLPREEGGEGATGSVCPGAAPAPAGRP